MSRGLRVAVCLPQVPFEHGGAEIHAGALIQALNERGHEATLVTLPYKWYPDAVLLESALLWRMTDLTESNGRPIDVVVGTKFPSYLVRHPRKVIWLFHQFRQAYDMHGTQFAQFRDDPHGAAMREAIRHMDGVALGEAAALFTTSENNAARLRRYNNLAAEVLPAPPQGLDLAWLGDEGYILSVGRLDPAKRVDLLLEGLALAPSVSAKIVGDGPDRSRLEGIVSRLGLQSRVAFSGKVDASELATLYGQCRAVFYAPHDEDYGFVPLEAHLAEKAVLTTTDAGGPLEVVKDGLTGLVVEPSAAEIGAALTRLQNDSRLARSLGAAGAERARALNWDAVVERLLAKAGV